MRRKGLETAFPDQILLRECPSGSLVTVISVLHAFIFFFFSVHIYLYDQHSCSSKHAHPLSWSPGFALNILKCFIILRGLQINEAFKMQMEVQKRLHEQLEVWFPPILRFCLLFLKCICIGFILFMNRVVQNKVHKKYSTIPEDTLVELKRGKK